MNESQQLLAQYTRTGSEAAFRELVGRYINLVYSTALRLVGGDTHLAEDVAQTVFVHFLRKAPRLSPDVMLGGWLHRASCNVAATVMRGERRRQARERQAAEMNAVEDHTEENLARLAPLLDDAIEQLGVEDRNAILLRFFEQREFGSMGQSLGISEDGARKRVSRALEKLELLLKRRGFAVSATVLASALGADAISAAPAGLGAVIAASSLAGGTASSGTAFTLFNLVTMTKLKAGIVGAILIGAVATSLVIQQQARLKLDEKEKSLARQAEHIRQVEAENERLSQNTSRASDARLPASGQERVQERELLRLRGEVGQLRATAREQVVQDALKQRDREVKLKELMRQMPNRSIPEFYLLGDGDLSDVARDADLDTEDGIRAAFYQLRFKAMNQFAILLQPALQAYTKVNNGQSPEDVGQLAPYFNPPINGAILQRYTVFHPDPNHIVGGWNGGWVITQREPVDGVDSRWFISPVGFSPGQFDPPEPGP